MSQALSEIPDRFWAGGFLFNPSTRAVLLHQRDSNTKINPNKWAFFGGLNEPGERPEECFQRELKEEVGLDLRLEDAILLRHYQNEELNTYRCVFYVLSEVDASELVLGEGAGLGWVPLSNLDRFDLTEKTKDDLAFFVKRPEPQ